MGRYMERLQSRAGGDASAGAVREASATVTQKGDVYEAAFEGDCGCLRVHHIMEGRAVGDIVMFKGTVNLGARDGGPTTGSAEPSKTSSSASIRVPPTRACST